MEPGEYERMYHAERWHWWYLGMESITCAMLNRFVSPLTGLKILDAGCGTGAAISTTLADYGNVIGFDISSLALKYCCARDLTPLVLASVTGIPFQSGSFDLVTSFDVLYERAVTSDSAALAEFFRILRPAGFLLLRLPAYDWLRGQHDLAIHTARRYTASQAAQLLKDSGFRILHITYANTFLFPLVVVKRLLDHICHPTSNSSDLAVNVGNFNGIFKQILSSEAFLATRVGLPFGSSVIVLGQRQKSA